MKPDNFPAMFPNCKRDMSPKMIFREDLKRTAINDCLNDLLTKMQSDEGSLSALALSEDHPNTQATLQEKPLEDRLHKLKGLRAKGLISPEEYYEKRAKLLAGF